MAKIPESRDSGLLYLSHAVCFKTARRRYEIAVAVNGFGNSLFPEIPQQFQPPIGKHGTVQYFHIPGMGGIDQSLGNICSTQEPYALKGFRHPADQFRFRFHRQGSIVTMHFLNPGAARPYAQVQEHPAQFRPQQQNGDVIVGHVSTRARIPFIGI